MSYTAYDFFFFSFWSRPLTFDTLYIDCGYQEYTQNITIHYYFGAHLNYLYVFYFTFVSFSERKIADTYERDSEWCHDQRRFRSRLKVVLETVNSYNSGTHV